MSSGGKVSMTIEGNNQNKQGGRKLKTVDYCLQYGIWLTATNLDDKKVKPK